MSFKKGIVTILLANILNLFFQLLTNFLLPKYLTIECYAEIKTFQLYVSYAGALHLGYCDGMYIKYGGKSLGDIDSNELKTDAMTLAVFQFVLLILLLTASIFMHSAILAAFAAAILPLNMVSYYNLLFQATGEFGAYSKVINVTTIATFIVNMGLLALQCFSEYHFFLLGYVVIDIFLMLLCTSFLYTKKKELNSAKGTLSLACMRHNIKSGFFLMLGNFSSIILTGMDRWFIKILMDNTAFAMYSFAVSMENLMNVAVSPVSTTLYNFFCVHTDNNALKNIKGKIILFATAIVACAFPAKFILETFLTKYLGSASVIFYLFGAQIFYIIVKCFYVNLYKAQRRQKIYFVKLTAVIVIGFLFNAGLYAVMHTKEAFAIGTMLCGVVWYFLSELDFPQLRSGWRENIFLLLATVSYLTFGTFMESLVGLLLYIAVLALLALLLMKKDVMACIQMVKDIINKKS